MNEEPDSDPATQINADPCRSGYETLTYFSIYFLCRVSEPHWHADPSTAFYLNVDPDLEIHGDPDLIRAFISHLKLIITFLFFMKLKRNSQIFLCVPEVIYNEFIHRASTVPK